MRFRTSMVVALLASASVGVGLAVAQSDDIARVTVVGPRDGATASATRPPTFAVRWGDETFGTVWVHVSKSRTRIGNGLIGDDMLIQRMRKGAGGVYRKKAMAYKVPTHWLSAPGTYYWQAYAIKCPVGFQKDRECYHPAGIRRLVVVR
jgi:hypothetical protein